MKVNLAPLSVLTGLAAGLAPKERRYVSMDAIRPNGLGPPLPAWGGYATRRGNSAFAGENLTRTGDGIIPGAGLNPRYLRSRCYGRASRVLPAGHASDEGRHLLSVPSLNDVGRHRAVAQAVLLGVRARALEAAVLNRVEHSDSPGLI